MRGWAGYQHGKAYRVTVIPAHAGVGPSRGASPASTSGDPRACGGGPRTALRDLLEDL